MRTRSKSSPTIWSAGKRVRPSLNLIKDLILNLIGWESGVSFVDQLHNEVKQNKAILDFFRHFI